MNVSRKEFLSGGLAAFGRSLLDAAREGEPATPDKGQVTVNGYLRLDNRRCLAQRGGCFACLDKCPLEAISISPGVGITINPDSCDGCGECVSVCPVEPKAIMMHASEEPVS